MFFPMLILEYVSYDLGLIIFIYVGDQLGVVTLQESLLTIIHMSIFPLEEIPSYEHQENPNSKSFPS